MSKWSKMVKTVKKQRKKWKKWSNVKLTGRDLQCTEKMGQELSQTG
jgi:hypothetical protein